MADVSLVKEIVLVTLRQPATAGQVAKVKALYPDIPVQCEVTNPSTPADHLADCKRLQTPGRFVLTLLPPETLVEEAMRAGFVHAVEDGEGLQHLTAVNKVVEPLVLPVARAVP